MPSVCAKLRKKEKCSYRKMLTIEDTIYYEDDLNINSCYPYTPGSTVRDDEWFKIDNASKQPYAIDLIEQQFESVDFTLLNKDEFTNIDYIFTEIDGKVVFQRITPSRIISKKRIGFGEKCEYVHDRQDIELNNIPDAIYVRETDTLLFKKLETISPIFKGIDQLYTEATEAETEEFLSSDFIKLKDGYSVKSVKKNNRKLIGVAIKILNDLDEDSKINIFSYIGDYCPKLKVSDSTFEIGTESDLKMLLYGIEQRFYTTVVGQEKRIANSTVLFSNK